MGYLASLPNVSILLEKSYQVLEQTFGYTAYRGLQREVIERVLAGQNALAVMPTGNWQILMLPGASAGIAWDRLGDFATHCSDA